MKQFQYELTNILLFPPPTATEMGDFAMSSPSRDAERDRLIQQLRMQQIELGLQNEALRAAQVALQARHTTSVDTRRLAPVGCVSVDMQGTIVEVNQTLAFLLGASVADLCGKPLKTVIALEQRGQFAAYLYQLRTGRLLAALPIDLVRNDGTRVSCCLAGLREDGDDHPDRIRFTISRHPDDSDPTARLIESERKLRDIVDRVTDGIAIVDEIGRVVLWNPGQERITGLRRRDVIGKHLWDLGATSIDSEHDTQERSEDYKRQILEVLQKGEGNLLGSDHGREFRIPSGDVTCVRQTYFSIPSANGFRLGMFTRDISEHKKTADLLRRRNDELAFLNRTSHAFAATLQSGPTDTFNTILRDLIALLNVSAAGLFLVNDEKAELDCHSWEDRISGTIAPSSGLMNVQLAHWVHKHGESVIVPNVAADNRSRHAGLRAGKMRIQSALCVPIRANGTGIGVIQLVDEQPNRFTPTDLCLVESLASSTAAWVETGRLYRNLHRLAALEERQRLAADLHDAINQSLFSANLIAEVLPSLWERNQQEARQSLADLHHLIRGATAELRLLLGDMRPALRADADLADLLHQLADAFTGRTKLPVSLDVIRHGSVPIRVQEVFYRVCQEALSNTAKHADAKRVAIRLQFEGGVVEMHISDDGRGFESQRVPGGRFGLSNLREQADAIKAQLSIASKPEHGTQLKIRWTATSEDKAR